VRFRNLDGLYITTPLAEKEKAIVNAKYGISAAFFNNEEIILYMRNKWIREEDRYLYEPKPHNCIICSIVYNTDGVEVAQNEKKYDI